MAKKRWQKKDGKKKELLFYDQRYNDVKITAQVIMK
jgi:hypothetical protein